MSKLVLKSEVDVRDFVRGCTFLGTGGGGGPSLGLKLLLEDLERFDEIAVDDPQDVRDDAWVCTPYLMGSIAPKSPEALEKMAEMGLAKTIGMADRKLVLAVLELERYAGVTIDAIVPIELGGANTPAPIDVALSLGKKIVNGDYAGRAIPEISQITTYLEDKPTHPTPYVDEWGNVTIVKNAINYLMAESIGKMISVAAFGLVGGAGLLMTGKEMKKVVIPGTLTECYEIGKALREAAQKGEDPAEEVAKRMRGWVLFKGKVTKKDWEDREGYLWGTNTIEGMDGFRGKEFKIFYKNENHVTWLDGKPYVTSPDIIEVIDAKKGEPITNTDISEGDVVSVLGLKAREPFRSPKGLDILGPKHFGYDIEYRPIEETVV